MFKIDKKQVQLNIFDNDNDALNPEVWAREALIQLYEETVMLPTVHIDYSDEVKRQGDVVNAHRPAKFEAERKVDGDEVQDQDAQSSNVAVPLDHHIYTSFVIYDGEESKSLAELIDLYLTPGIQSMAQEADEMIAGQKYAFRNNVVGKLGTAIDKSTLIAINKTLTQQLCPKRDRYFAFGAEMEADLLEEALFTDASQVGDDGTALRNASIGRKFNMWNIQGDNFVEVPDQVATFAGAVNNAGGYAKGYAGEITTDGYTAGNGVAVGMWCTIAGEDQPKQITAVNGIIGITLDKPLTSAIVDDAVITFYTPGAINLAAGYAAGYNKRLVVDGFSGGALSQGQLATFGTSTDPHTMIGGKITSTSLKLDHSLAVAAADDTAVYPGPAGNFGLAYHKNAIAFVNRPLQLARVNGTSTKQAIFDYKGLSIRVTMTYDSKVQGTRVVLDMLCGVKVLDTRLGTLVCG